MKSYSCDDGRSTAGDGSEADDCSDAYQRCAGNHKVGGDQDEVCSEH